MYFGDVLNWPLGILCNVQHYLIRDILKCSLVSVSF
jgi:hypothetical protein